MNSRAAVYVVALLFTVLGVAVAVGLGGWWGVAYGVLIALVGHLVVWKEVVQPAEYERDQWHAAAMVGSSLIWPGSDE